MAAYDVAEALPRLESIPLLVITSQRDYARADGEKLYADKKGPKKFHLIAKAGHFDLYDLEPYVTEAVDQIRPFFAATTRRDRSLVATKTRASLPAEARELRRTHAARRTRWRARPALEQRGRQGCPRQHRDHERCLRERRIDPAPSRRRRRGREPVATAGVEEHPARHGRARAGDRRRGRAASAPVRPHRRDRDPARGHSARPRACSAKGRQHPGVFGKGTFGGRGYRGPTPVPDHGPHTYVFQLFALAAPLPGDRASLSRAQLAKAMAGHRPRARPSRRDVRAMNLPITKTLVAVLDAAQLRGLHLLRNQWSRAPRGGLGLQQSKHVSRSASRFCLFCWAWVECCCCCRKHSGLVERS